MRIAILTFDGFNELDSFIALGLLNRLLARQLEDGAGVALSDSSCRHTRFSCCGA